MQISDMLGQYNRNISKSSTEELKGASGMQKIVSTVDKLQAGSIFEGTVSSVKNGKVVLALSDGQTITAQMDGKVSLSVGAPMFFQVKSNDGNIVSIRPYGTGNMGNPILLNALTTAGIPANERNLAMVDAMMQEKMPIDKQSILDMVKTINLNPEVSVKTIIQMVKLGIPVSPEMAAQFESYQNEEHAILKELNQVIDQISVQPGSEDLNAAESVELNRKLLETFMGKDPVSVSENGSIAAENGQETLTATADSVTGAQSAEQETVSGLRGEGQQAVSGGPDGMMQAQNEEVPLNQVLSEEQISNLTKLLQSMPTLIENKTLFPEADTEDVFVDTMSEEGEKFVAKAGKTATGEIAEEPIRQPALDEHLTVEKFLRAVDQGLLENQEFGFSGVKKLFASTEYRLLLSHVIEKEWLLSPEELKTPDKLKTQYEKIERQMTQLENIMKSFGVNTDTFSKTTSDVRGNIEFMNQINQLYTYVQLPLKLTGQNANGELYVYTNKKQLMDPEGELSAFLHLDLEHLGSTDVSVKMKQKNVKTNFYFSDDTSYALVEHYLPVLEEKLAKKGYHCSFSISREEQEVKFVDDFLRKDQPQAGTLHRYSFDMKA